MVSKILDGEIVIASHNKGKIIEFSDLFKDYNLNLSSSSDYNIEEPEENGSSFAENALIKAKATMLGSKKIAISDDSGLCVDCLNGEPGIYSARWAGRNKDFSVAMEKINKKLLEIDPENTNAHFFCALAVVWPNGEYKVYEGAVHGSLSFPPKGNLGFGYDPIFIPTGFDISFGEMEPSKKHSISHRAIAFDKLKKELLDG